MSDISFQFEIQSLPEKTYKAVHDNLPEIIEAIPIIHHSNRKSESSKNAEQHYVDIWTVNVLDALSAFLSNLLDFEHVSIRSESDWHEDEYLVEFKLMTLNWESLLKYCRGEIQFSSSESNTTVEVWCDFHVSLSQIPGLPSFLANRLQKKLKGLAESQVEYFIPVIQNAITSKIQN